MNLIWGLGGVVVIVAKAQRERDIGDNEVLLEPGDEGAIVSVGGSSDSELTNLAFDHSMEPLVSMGQIRNGSTFIKLGSDGIITFRCNGKDLLDITPKNIILGGDIKISLDTIRAFASVVNSKFGANELFDIVKDRMKIENNKDLADKRLGAIINDDQENI